MESDENVRGSQTPTVLFRINPALKVDTFPVTGNFFIYPPIGEGGSLRSPASRQEMSGGSLVSFIHDAPPGTGVPMHIHRDDDECLYVIDGELIAQLGDEKLEARQGDIVYMPKSISHGFRITGESMSKVLSPTSDSEKMFDGLSRLQPKETEKTREVCAANNVTFLSPPSAVKMI